MSIEASLIYVKVVEPALRLSANPAYDWLITAYALWAHGSLFNKADYARWCEQAGVVELVVLATSEGQLFRSWHAVSLVFQHRNRDALVVLREI